MLKRTDRLRRRQTTVVKAVYASLFVTLIVAVYFLFATPWWRLRAFFVPVDARMSSDNRRLAVMEHRDLFSLRQWTMKEWEALVTFVFKYRTREVVGVSSRPSGFVVDPPGHPWIFVPDGVAVTGFAMLEISDGLTWDSWSLLPYADGFAPMAYVTESDRQFIEIADSDIDKVMIHWRVRDSSGVLISGTTFLKFSDRLR